MTAERSTGPRRAVIVGNSDGIGYTLTRRLLGDGWIVAGLSRSASDLRHERYRHMVADVTSAGYPEALAAEADALGGVDLCVYAAGVGEFIDVTDLSPQTRALEVNLIGAARTVEVIVPRMAAAGGGHVIGLSSLADAMPSAAAPGYAASKAGLSAYLRGLSLALRPHGVAVTTFRPGFVDTKMAKSNRRPAMLTADQAADIIVRAIARRPVVISRPRRMALAMRLAAAIIAICQLKRPRRPPRQPLAVPGRPEPGRSGDRAP